MQCGEEYGRNRGQREFKIVNREIGLVFGDHTRLCVFWRAPSPANQERSDARARRTAAEAAALPTALENTRACACSGGGPARQTRNDATRGRVQRQTRRRSAPPPTSTRGRSRGS